jgi:predicted carbohydrate-binding protein with CBM5 and CBM33 domain
MEEFRKAFAVATVLLLCYALPVSGHGMMIHPVSRNFMAYLKGGEWCPHCLNAGGELVQYYDAAVAQMELSFA